MKQEEMVSKALLMSDSELDAMADRGEELLAKGTAMTDAEIQELTEIYIIAKLAPSLQDAAAAGWTGEEIMTVADELLDSGHD